MPCRASLVNSRQLFSRDLYGRLQMGCLALAVVLSQVASNAPAWPFIPLMVNRIFELLTCFLGRLTALVNASQSQWGLNSSGLPQSTIPSFLVALFSLSYTPLLQPLSSLDQPVSFLASKEVSVVKATRSP